MRFADNRLYVGTHKMLNGNKIIYRRSIDGM